MVYEIDENDHRELQDLADYLVALVIKSRASKVKELAS